MSFAEMALVSWAGSALILLCEFCTLLTMLLTIGVMFSAVAVCALRESEMFPTAVSNRDMACKRKGRTQLRSSGCELCGQVSQDGSDGIALAFDLHGGGGLRSSGDGCDGAKREGNKGGEFDEREHSCSE